MTVYFDLVGVVVIVAAAVIFLVARFRSPSPPACHSTSAPLEAAPTVVLGASLQKGLQRARARERSSEKRVSA